MSYERHYQLLQHKLALNSQHDTENAKLLQENESLTKQNEALANELRSIKEVIAFFILAYSKDVVLIVDTFLAFLGVGDSKGGERGVEARAAQRSG